MQQESMAALESVKSALPTIVVALSAFALITTALHTSRGSVCLLASSLDTRMLVEIVPTTPSAPRARIVNRAIASNLYVLLGAILHNTDHFWQEATARTVIHVKSRSKQVRSPPTCSRAQKLEATTYRWNLTFYTTTCLVAILVIHIDPSIFRAP